MKDELFKLYDGFHKRKVQIPPELQERLSTPLLLCPTESWIKAPKRVLIVGQETLGWDFAPGWYYQWDFPEISSFKDFKVTKEAVEALIYGYRIFQFAKEQPKNYRSPFWQAYRQIRKNFDTDVDGLLTGDRHDFKEIAHRSKYKKEA